MLADHATSQTHSGETVVCWVRKPPTAVMTSDGMGGNTFSRRVERPSAR